MRLMLNKALEWRQYQALFERDGHVRIPDVLESGFAEEIHGALSGALDWELVCSGTSADEDVTMPESEYNRLDGARKAQIVQHLLNGARAGYAFYYYRHELYKTGNQMLARFYEEIASAPFLGFINYVTGEHGIRRRSGMATSFRQGSFLRTHDDEGADKDRRVAYVFGFTRGWQADWGGALNFPDETGRTTLALVPGFNELSMFRVPRDHFVSQVANYAPMPRLSMTGWFMV
jgi:SM-20-related protein